MTFRRTSYEPYDPSSWTASKELADVSDDVARERAPKAGVPLRSTYFGVDMASVNDEHDGGIWDDDVSMRLDEMASCTCIGVDIELDCPSHGVPDDDIDNTPGGYDATDFAKDK